MPKLILTDEEHDRRLAICQECPDKVLTVLGACDTCGKHHYVHAAKTDAELTCRKTKSCSGEVHGREAARCGACGCPLATRVYAWCPKRKW